MALLTSPKALASVMLHADEAELHNIDIEANNAAIYRMIKRALQQKLRSLEDVSSSWGLKLDREIWCNDFGDLEYPADAEPAPEPKKIRGGGGGLARAFFASSPRMRTADNRPDFAAISQAYREERAKAESPLLESLKQRARAATQTRQDQFRAGSRWDTSSFGLLSKQAVQRQRREAQTRALRDHAVEALEGTDGTSVVGASCSALVARNTDDAGRLAVLAHSELGEQVAALRRVARFDAAEERARKEQEARQFRDTVLKPTVVEGVDLHKQMGLEEGSVRSLQYGDMV